jgi:hypothetical protein
MTIASLAGDRAAEVLIQSGSFRSVSGGFFTVSGIGKALVFTFLAGLSNSAIPSDQTFPRSMTPALFAAVLALYFLPRTMPPGEPDSRGAGGCFRGPWAVTILGASCLLIQLE